jgi:hypothetical protein
MYNRELNLRVIEFLKERSILQNNSNIKTVLIKIYVIYFYHFFDVGNV